MKPTEKILIAFAGGLALAAVTMAGHAAPPKTLAKPAPQKVTITLPDGYKTGTASVKAGKPVALTFFLKSEAGCGDEVVVPAAKWRKNLAVGQKATVNFTPKKSGPLIFSCGMNMLHGSIVVK